jgi:hypothetical protein
MENIAPSSSPSAPRTPDRARRGLPAAGAAVALAAALALAVAGPLHATPAAWAGTVDGPACRSADVALPGALDPEEISMTPARRGSGAAGTLSVRLGDSPFGVAVSRDGSYRYRVEVTARRLPDLDGGAYVVWAATPSLEEHARLGVLEAGSPVSGTVRWNKFLVFVTAEESPDPERWSQRFVLSALSPSGRMHTMAGHGPFSGEPCLDPRQ